MDNRAEIKDFLSSRRAKITPEQAGLSAYARNRRVPGLRRSEVADLAGVSVEYYAQLERGDLSGVSDSVLEALARAPAGPPTTSACTAPAASTSAIPSSVTCT
jgi:transcriptional regulator with XRE-family HTH domain